MQSQAIVPLILPAHILAGALAIMLGYLALYAAKGATLHRKSGILFVYFWRLRARQNVRGSAGVHAPARESQVDVLQPVGSESTT